MTNGGYIKSDSVNVELSVSGAKEGNVSILNADGKSIGSGRIKRARQVCQMGRIKCLSVTAMLGL